MSEQQAIDWMEMFIIREDIQAFAVNKTTNQEGENRTYLNFYMTKLREPDSRGNTHTLYIQSYDKETGQRGDKIYIGKAKSKIQTFTEPAAAAPAPAAPKPEADDLPF